MSPLFHTVGAIVTLQALDTAVVADLIASANQIDPQLGLYLSFSLKLGIFLVYLYTVISKKVKGGKDA